MIRHVTFGYLISMMSSCKDRQLNSRSTSFMIANSFRKRQRADFLARPWNLICSFHRWPSCIPWSSHKMIVQCWVVSPYSTYKRPGNYLQLNGHQRCRWCAAIPIQSLHRFLQVLADFWDDGCSRQDNSFTNLQTFSWSWACYVMAEVSSTTFTVLLLLCDNILVNTVYYHVVYRWNRPWKCSWKSLNFS